MIEILSDKLDASSLMKQLAAAKVGTRPCFYPMHLQPVFVSNERSPYFGKTLKLGTKKDFRENERLCERSFYLPSGLGLTDEDIELLVDRSLEVFAEAFLGTNEGRAGE